MSKHLFFAIVLIAFGVSALIVSVGLRTYPGGRVPFDYGIVLDAGSTHTSVYLYKWLADQVNNTGVVSEVRSCKTRFGIDDNEGNTETMLDDLLPCVQNITNLIEVRENDITQIYLGATAGMRLLNISKPHLTKIIFLEIENALLRLREKSKSFDIKDIRILSGREEALFGWVQTNYLLKVFPNFGSHSSMPARDSYGMLDMGGASAQIAYEVKGSDVKHFRNVSKVRLYGHDYFVRAESNLCFGADEVLARYRYLQIAGSAANVRRFNDPCYLKGSEITVSGRDIFTICTQTLSGAPSKGYAESDNKFTFVGAYNEDQCTRLIDRLLNKNECQRTFKYCFIEEKANPPENMTFYAMSSYFYATRAISDQTNQQKSFEYDQYVTDTNLFCSKEYSFIENTNRLKKVSKYAINYCFQLRYFLAAFRNVYKFNKDQFENIHFVRKISENTLGWALGFMINATNLIPPEVPNNPIISINILIILVIVCLVIICVGLWCLNIWRSKRQRKVRTGKEARALELNEKI